MGVKGHRGTNERTGLTGCDYCNEEYPLDKLTWQPYEGLYICDTCQEGTHNGNR